MATKQPDVLKIEVIRAFRMSGLDPATPHYTGDILGVGAVVSLPNTFARQMISGGKAKLSTEPERPAKELEKKTVKVEKASK